MNPAKYLPAVQSIVNTPGCIPRHYPRPMKALRSAFRVDVVQKRAVLPLPPLDLTRSDTDYVVALDLWADGEFDHHVALLYLANTDTVHWVDSRGLPVARDVGLYARTSRRLGMRQLYAALERHVRAACAKNKLRFSPQATVSRRFRPPQDVEFGALGPKSDRDAYTRVPGKCFLWLQIMLDGMMKHRWTPLQWHRWFYSKPSRRKPAGARAFIHGRVRAISRDCATSLTKPSS
ncbi:hypothetical protein GHT06_003873 [Daphnia sinensis]|uniref:Uncharacterized protein n=1 Tax=Daphnia sinensis TaxID=1820382 RepID=A0AAD5KDT8_9CRUS|nr:hypothetical protein GHT06_003873 [Daphnia sinensis]